METMIDSESGLPIVWSYWEGNTPPAVQLCIDTIRKYNPSFRLITPDILKEMEGGGAVLKFTEGLRPQFRSDYVRLWLLYNFGGVWTDTDVIFLQPLDWFTRVDITKVDLIGTHNPHNKSGYGRTMTATPFGGRAGSPVLKEGLVTCSILLQKMKNGKKVNYGKTSCGILGQLYKKYKTDPKKVIRFQHWRYNRVSWQRAKAIFLKRSRPPEHEWRKAYNPGAVCYHLTNVPIHHYRNAQTVEILNDKTFMSFLLQKALKRIPAVAKRSTSILNNIKQDAPVVGVEVGVCKGINSRHLLQQRPDMFLHMVDLWGAIPNEDRYRKTRDGRAFDSQAKRNKHYNLTKKHTAFAGGRIKLHRMTSTDAAKTFADESLDFIFIDAEHSYEGVLEDLKAWYPKIKKGGLIAGHDYNNKNFPGVAKAVNEFFKGQKVTQGYDYVFTTHKI